MNDDQVLKELNEVLSQEPGAKEFVLNYQQYVHAIDDIIDLKITEPEKILVAFNLARELFTNPFYRKYYRELSFTEMLVNNQYADCVAWEHSDEEWKRVHADSLRHVGYSILYACIAICGGYDTLRKLSPRIRENAHYLHLKDVT